MYWSGLATKLLRAVFGKLTLVRFLMSPNPVSLHYMGWVMKIGPARSNRTIEVEDALQTYIGEL
jgi:hypothetical protein